MWVSLLVHYVLASSGRRSDENRRRFEHEVDVHRVAGVPRQVVDRDQQGEGDGGAVQEIDDLERGVLPQEFTGMEDHDYCVRGGLNRSREVERYPYQMLAGPLRQEFEMRTYSMGTGAVVQRRDFWQGRSVTRRWSRQNDLSIGEDHQLQFQIDDLGPLDIFSPRDSPVDVPAVGANVEVGEDVGIDVMVAIDEGDGLVDIDVGVVEVGENVEIVDNDE